MVLKLEPSNIFHFDKELFFHHITAVTRRYLKPHHLTTSPLADVYNSFRSITQVVRTLSSINVYCIMYIHCTYNYTYTTDALAYTPPSRAEVYKIVRYCASIKSAYICICKPYYFMQIFMYLELVIFEIFTFICISFHVIKRRLRVC